MSLKYKVKLIHNAGYHGIQHCIGKEFNAVYAEGLLYIKSEDFESKDLPLGTNLVFGKHEVEMIEIRTGGAK